MEHDSSFNKQLKKEIIAGAVMNKRNEILEVDVSKYDEKVDEMSQEINRIKKPIRRRRQKDEKIENSL